MVASIHSPHPENNILTNPNYIPLNANNIAMINNQQAAVAAAAGAAAASAMQQQLNQVHHHPNNTCTKFSDNYEVKEELGKWVLFYGNFFCNIWSFTYLQIKLLKMRIVESFALYLLWFTIIFGKTDILLENWLFSTFQEKFPADQFFAMNTSFIHIFNKVLTVIRKNIFLIAFWNSSCFLWRLNLKWLLPSEVHSQWCEDASRRLQTWSSLLKLSTHENCQLEVTIDSLSRTNNFHNKVSQDEKSGFFKCISFPAKLKFDLLSISFVLKSSKKNSSNSYKSSLL